MCIRQRIGGSNPPLTAIFKARARTKVRAFFFYSLRKGGMRIPDRGSTTGDSQLDRLRAQRTDCPKGERSESIPPLTAIFKTRARTKVRAFFLYSLRKGGMRIPDRGSTTGDSQLDRLRAQRTGCPKGERSESIPPSPPYSRQELVRKYGLFSFIVSEGGDENPRPGFDKDSSAT